MMQPQQTQKQSKAREKLNRQAGATMTGTATLLLLVVTMVPATAYLGEKVSEAFTKDADKVACSMDGGGTDTTSSLFSGGFLELGDNFMDDFEGECMAR